MNSLQSREAVEIVERAFVRVSAPLNYHEGYWVGQTRVEGVPVPVTTLNDIHVDVYSGRVTVYGQAQVAGVIIAPVQVDEGEVAQHFGGNMLGMHPNAVYLNGSGEELTESDGTGSWWIKHAIIRSSYYNWPLLTTDYSFGGQFTYGTVLDDSVTLMMRAFPEGDTYAGFPVNPDSLTLEIYGNTRHPGFETDSVTHVVTRYEPANVNAELGPIDYTGSLGLRVVNVYSSEILSEVC